MPTESTTDPKFDIGHILFIDVVGYSKLNIDEQSRLLGARSRRESAAQTVELPARSVC